MQMPEDPFAINELYQKAVDDISNNRLKSKNKEELVFMRGFFVAYPTIDLFNITTSAIKINIWHIFISIQS
jgi:hypothetical protein